MGKTLRIVLGDQLDSQAPLVTDYQRGDVFWMAEVAEESLHVPSHKARSVYFLSAMRHFARDLKSRKQAVDYHALDTHSWSTLEEALRAAIDKHSPEEITVTEPGDRRVAEMLRGTADSVGLPLHIYSDTHFFSTIDDFHSWASGRKSLRMEYFYRELRKRYGVLMDDDKPCGGKWNYDGDNRESFGAQGPGLMSQPTTFKLDKITRDVIALVNERFPDNPGSTERFDWPVTAQQAQEALQDFIDNRLVGFGQYQDALWHGEPWLYHSRLSAAMNLKLLNPRDVVAAVERAYRNGYVALNAAEGFIRQVLGWREYVRGLYFTHYDRFAEGNALEASADLPGFYWTGDTDMACLKDAITQTLDYGYAHHIQRLMVTGLFSLLFGVKPEQIHSWYLAIYVDAIEWVEMPNTLGMSQYADGGLMASKPYVASGKYIQRMGNYCDQCPYNPAKRSGENACPFTALYWDFLIRHEQRFSDHPRMALQVRNIKRLSHQEKSNIRDTVRQIRNRITT
ncbi:deoxyribodipyrimidine photolyase-related protein [Litorivivens lipolytica]|uniref:Deoxyribodipyrimidine photolyase-related protein n=1 Tax=Litorivivens lipolytica TaxID=1524264 RepID=A0A7W4Z5L0_9GAMM|nr:cryptochrome/photolyase family protein [Litorivivens lipolytica]MBB3047599.1 deoxyribodipyrimidine photolyase-related protein [Litorivivens lipolytica]